MAEGLWGDYLRLLGRVTKALEDLSAVEQEKTQAVARGDLPAVEACMKKEQVASLNLRGLDQRREKILDQLDMKGVPLRDIMQYCPGGAENETRDAANALRRQYEIFQSVSQVSRHALEINLHELEKMQKQMNGGVPVQNIPPTQADFRA